MAMDADLEHGSDDDARHLEVARIGQPTPGDFTPRYSQPFRNDEDEVVERKSTVPHPSMARMKRGPADRGLPPQLPFGEVIEPEPTVEELAAIEDEQTTESAPKAAPLGGVPLG